MAELALTAESIGNIIGAVAALGTAAYGLVDAGKAFGGGISLVGLGPIRAAVGRFVTLDAAGTDDVSATIKANWLNGVAKAEQKAMAKGLIRLALAAGDQAQVQKLATATNIPVAELTAVATAVNTGAQLTQPQIGVLGQFDTVVSAALDAGYERGDQAYRNASKLAGAVVAVVLAVIGGALISKGAYWFTREMAVAILVGLVSTPLAPIAKDLSSALVAAVKAVSAAKR